MQSDQILGLILHGIAATSNHDNQPPPQIQQMPVYQAPVYKDNCSDPRMQLGLIDWMNKEQIFPRSVVDLQNMVTPSSVPLNDNPDPATGLICHVTVVFQGNISEDGLISTKDPGNNAPLNILWKSDAGEQAPVTPNPPPPPAAPITPTKTVTAIPAPATTMPYVDPEIVHECDLLESYAATAIAYKNMRISYEQTFQQITSQAYGPNGEVFRGSDSAYNLLATVVVGAWKWNKNGSAYPTYVMKQCMAGKPYDLIVGQ